MSSAYRATSNIDGRLCNELPPFQIGDRCPLGVDCDNLSRPKAVIHYWRNRFGTPYNIGGFILPDNTAIASSTSSIARI